MDQPIRSIRSSQLNLVKLQVEVKSLNLVKLKSGSMLVIVLGFQVETDNGERHREANRDKGSSNGQAKAQ